jgi:hypothetical protein
MSSAKFFNPDKYICTPAGFAALPRVLEQIHQEAAVLDEETVGYLIRAAHEAIEWGVERNHALCMSYMVGLSRNEKAY